MLKTISAALLAASVIAAPAFAAKTTKSTTRTTNVHTAAQAPVIKANPSQTKMSANGKSATSEAKAGVKADARSKAMNANAAIAPGEHHKSVRSHRHHRKVVSAKKARPDLAKPMAPAASHKRS
jgi:hypothetical protein